MKRYTVDLCWNDFDDDDSWIEESEDSKGQYYKVDEVDAKIKELEEIIKELRENGSKERIKMV